jgi:toxin ParE1/3/4
MTGYVLSPRARGDIEGIWDYTAERWGLDQAETYLRDIQRAIETITADPTRGRSCDEIRSAYLRFSVGSHILFYRLAEGRVDVVRILHQQMDFDRHL